jgi:hypothetical protein
VLELDTGELVMIHLFTAHSKAYIPLNDITYPTKVAYAARHGFTCSAVQCEFPDGWMRPLIWLEALSAIPEREYLFWTGTDVAITNLDFKPVLGEFDFYFAVDHHGLQSDSWLLRNCSATHEFLRAVSARKGQEANEQDAMQVILSGRPSYASLRWAYDSCGSETRESWFARELNKSPVTCRILPREVINGLPHEHYGGTGLEHYSWKPGCFVLHTPGKSLEWRLEWMPKLILRAL